MKIGIVSNGNSTLALWKVLTKYDNEYLVYHHQLHFPFGEKDFSFVIAELEKAVGFLVEQGAEVVIIDPVYELALSGGSSRLKGEVILPLFHLYLQAYVFRHSLVGKVGILTDFGSCDTVQEFIIEAAKGYQLTENQKNIKKFSFPFHYRVKAANARPAGIASLGTHNPYLIRTLKNDLRYFKDAKVDTLVPMHYQYFRMQRTIKGFFNFHKTRFHDLSAIDICFKNLVAGQASLAYSVHLRTNQDEKFLFREKELMWLLERGKRVKMQVARI